jgi:cytochrome d ubiquinol oxidase subunit II
MLPAGITVALPLLPATVVGVLLLAWVLATGKATGSAAIHLLQRPETLRGHPSPPSRAGWGHLLLGAAFSVLASCFPDAGSGIARSLGIPITGLVVACAVHGVALVRHGERSKVATVAGALVPFLAGTCAGAAVSGDLRVLGGEVRSGQLAPWLAPFPLSTGLALTSTCALLAATRPGTRLTSEFSRMWRSGAAIATLVTSLLTLGLAWPGAPTMLKSLWRREVWPAVAIVLACWVLALAATHRDRVSLAHAATLAGITMTFAGWGMTKHPYLLLPDITLDSAAAPDRIIIRSLAIHALLALLAGGWLMLRWWQAGRSRREGRRGLPGRAP